MDNLGSIDQNTARIGIGHCRLLEKGAKLTPVGHLYKFLLIEACSSAISIVTSQLTRRYETLLKFGRGFGQFCARFRDGWSAQR
ncbi:MAG: hypothetical protein GY820_04715 [Gammaproteobacteria bacterium]|nr:hypothetical protein [Gammaproteobacteria bacterium]